MQESAKKGLENVLEKVHKKVLSQDVTQKSTTKSTGKNTEESAPVREYSQRRAINGDLPEKCVTNLGRSIYCKIALSQIKHTINNVGDCYLCEIG